MGAWLDYASGVSQNVIAAGLALVWHHRRVVAPLLRQLIDREECRCAEEAGKRTEGRGEEEEGVR